MFAKLAAATCLAATALLSGVSAHAATGPRIDSLVCNSGDTHFYCYLEVSGGTTPYEVDWAVTNGSVAESGVDFANGPCVVSTKVKATAAVTDAAGARVTGSAYTQCRAVWP